MPARVGCWTKASWIRDWGKRDPASAAKDRMSVKEFLQVENQSEEKLEKIREAGAEIRAGFVEVSLIVRSKGLSADG